MSLDFLNRHLKLIFFLGIALYLSVALTNVGIIATDDYEFGISRVVPAQNWSVAKIVSASGIRNPLQAIFLFSLTKTALNFGTLEPVSQLKFALCIVGLMTFLLNSFFSYRLFVLLGAAQKGVIPVFLLGFFFLSPLLFTRPLIETMASPFVMGSAYFACRYFSRGSQLSLLGALCTIAVASVFRYQVGVCGLALFILVLWKRNLKDLFLFVLASAALYVITGIPDLIYKGALHASLFSYTRYQMAEISKFGKQPFYVFIALFAGLSFPPVLISKYKNLNWRREYAPLVPVILYFIIFVFTHSLVTHKEERFMIPVFPLFMVLMTPVIVYLMQEPGNEWRFRFFAAVNFLLLPLASFSVPQNNLVGVATFLEKHPVFTKVTDVGETLFNFPKAFISHPLETGSVAASQVSEGIEGNCAEVLAIRKDVVATMSDLDNRYIKLAAFQPGLLESLLIKLNPRQNKRRGAIEIYVPKHCSSTLPDLSTFK